MENNPNFISIPAAVTNILARLLNVAASNLGERLGKVLGGKEAIPILVEKVKSDPRYLRSQLDYWEEKAAREMELRQLSPVEIERKIQLQEAEIQARYQLSLLQRKLLGEWQAKAVESKLAAIQNQWHKDAWFGNFSWQDTEQILRSEQHRLLLLVAPPKISKDCPDSFENNLAIELRKVGQFIQCYYNLEHKLSTVEFYSDYFKLPISDLEVKRLQPILSPIPTVAIYSDISDYEFHLRLGFWGLQPQQVFLLTTLSWNWEKVLEELETAGYSVKQSLRTIRTAIVTLHKLLAAFLADAYYLYIDANYQPQLFDLTEEFDEEWVQPYLKVLKQIQQRQRQNYQQELQQLADAETKRREAESLKTNAQKWQCINTFAGHANWVCCLAISPDGEILASGSSDNSVKIWNLLTGREICTFAGHLERVDSVTFSPDGKTLVSTSSDNSVKLWNLRTKQEICTITGNLSRVFPILVRRDKNLDGKTEDRKINLWDLTMGQDIRVLNSNSGRSFPVVISPDGEIIAGGGDENAIKLWNLKTGEEIRTLMGHSHWVNSVAFSPDGQTLASGSVDDTIKLWDLKTGKELRTFAGHTHWVNSVAFSPDGQTLASGSMDRTIKLWSLKTGEEIRPLAGHAGGVISVAMSPDGKTLVSGSTDGIIKIWQCN